jgi:hypothetical protein
MLPTRTISETMVASCTASGSNVSDACSDLCFIRCKSKPEAATTIANILYLSLSSNKSVRSVHFVLCGLMSFKRERARGVSLFLSLLCVCVNLSLVTHSFEIAFSTSLAETSSMCACVRACVCVCLY